MKSQSVQKYPRLPRGVYISSVFFLTTSKFFFGHFGISKMITL